MYTEHIKRATYYRSKDGDQIRQAFAIAQRERLPEKKTPAKKEKHVSRSLIESCDGNTRLSGEGYED